MSIVLVGSTSGSITLQEPAVAGSNTISLPAETGTVITTASSGQSIPKAALPTGSVLQVVNGATSTETSATTTTQVDTGLTATITPLYSTSKILVLVSQKIFCNPNASNNGSGSTVKLLRGATTLITAERVGLSDGTGAMDNYFSTSYLDSPASTSALTYKTTMALYQTAAAATVFAQLTSCPSGITLMEIAA